MIRLELSLQFFLKRYPFMKHDLLRLRCECGHAPVESAIKLFRTKNSVGAQIECQDCSRTYGVFGMTNAKMRADIVHAAGGLCSSSLHSPAAQAERVSLFQKVPKPLVNSPQFTAESTLEFEVV